MTIAAQKETLGFDTDVKKVLDIVIHSLYSNKEIFLRELISNASDAADKLRFEALSDKALLENDTELYVKVDVDKENRTISVTDNGIGMSRNDVIENLGTIAKSGTDAFMKSLTGDQTKDANLIGQFGVGFYSTFIVADKIIVESRRAGMNADQGVRWESDGAGNYSVENIERAERGTKITLHLKKDEEDFLEPWRLRTIINKYSDHIPLAIMMEKPEMPSTEDEKDKDKEKEAKAEKKAPEYETVNKATALWTLPKSQIKEEEYKELYKHISHDFEEPLLYTHNKVEGKQEYTTLLYLPQRAPFDLWNREHVRGLKLYVQRVFIMDNAEQFLPNYLRFVKGIVDSNDLPLNISREILQNNKLIDTMRAAITKRVVSMLEKLAKDDKEKYTKFWGEFGQVLKEGLVEDFAHKEQLAKLLRLSSTHTDSEKPDVTLEDYVARMREGQEKIYYLTAENFNTAKNSPHLEVFRKKNIEVLLLPDRIDEWVVSHLTEFDGKSLQSIAKGDLDMGKLEDEKEKQDHEKIEKEFTEIVKQVKKTLGDKVKDVKITHRLTDSPACIVADEQDMGGHMQRILQAAGQSMPASKPILELNPAHPIVSGLKTEPDDDRFSEISHLLFEQSVLAEGGHLDDPALFIKRLNKLLLGYTLA